MYYLKKNPFTKVTQEAARDVIETTKMRLEDSTQGLVFNEEEHRYFLHGRELRSVSSIVEEFAPFDTRAKAEKASTNPRHEYYGKSVDEIIALWEENRDRAAAAGTQVHAFGEACFLWMLGREDEIEEQFRDRITAEGLAAVTPKEESCAKWWNDLEWQRLAVVAKETRVANPVLGYAGTFDLLLYDLFDAVFRMKDYKSNEDLTKWYGDMCLPPLNMLRANDVGKYTIQQNSYAIELDNIGIQLGSIDLIWLREDAYEEIPIDMRYRKVISYAIKTKLQQI